jgi:tripartite-type tricarboxylate transporter receptor subunit TctC
MKCFVAAVGIAGALILTGGTQAAEWPTKPVKIIVAYAAGGANDLLARVFAERLSEAFRQQFVVENRTGGGLIWGGCVSALRCRADAAAQ